MAPDSRSQVVSSYLNPIHFISPFYSITPMASTEQFLLQLEQQYQLFCVIYTNEVKTRYFTGTSIDAVFDAIENQCPWVYNTIEEMPEDTAEDTDIHFGDDHHLYFASPQHALALWHKANPK